MKRIASILTGLSLAVLFSVASAQAQSAGQKITANIPFDFTARNVSFPAGQYQFVRTGVGIYTIRDADGRSLLVMSGASVWTNGTPEKTNLKFALVDGHHVLIQIWSEVTDTGNDFPYPSAESARHAAVDGIVTNES